MDLHDIEARAKRPLRRRAEGTDDPLDIVDGQRTRDRIGRRKWFAGRADWRPPAVRAIDSRDALPRRRRAPLAPGMRQLHPSRAFLLVNEPDDPRQSLDVPIIVDAEIPRADSPFR